MLFPRKRVFQQIVSLVPFPSAPRVKTRGDFVGLDCVVPCVVFQSAPRVKTRGDTACVVVNFMLFGFNPRRA